MKKNILLINNYLDELIPNPICELNYQKDYLRCRRDQDSHRCAAADDGGAFNGFQAVCR